MNTNSSSGANDILRDIDMRRTLRVLLVVVIIAAEIGVCCWTMSLNPIWNGENPQHRNQYEQLAHSLAEGQLDFQYKPDSRLAELDNPYSPEERNQSGIPFCWDHSYYNDKYYMYFGIVPELELFLPYYLATGADLTTFHATQLYVAGIIIAFYALFFMLRRKAFPNLPFLIALLCAFASSIGSVWYACARPALYCTAISAGICHMLWSLTLLVAALSFKHRFYATTAFVLFGSIFGALTFGCRPAIGIVNFLCVIPLVAAFIRHSSLNGRRKATVVLIGILPYLVIGTALMLYNNARFDNPFEFGQAYQLTVADQSGYKIGNGLEWSSAPKTLLRIFFGFSGIGQFFPYISYNGVFLNFPYLIISLGVIHPTIFKRLNSAAPGLGMLGLGILLSAIAIVCVSLAWSPKYLERYNMDIYWMLFVAAFLVVGALFKNLDNLGKVTFSVIVGMLAVATAISAVLLFFVPESHGLFVDVPESIELVESLGFEVELPKS